MNDTDLFRDVRVVPKAGRVGLAVGMLAQADRETCTTREEFAELLASAKSAAYTGERTSGRMSPAVAEQLRRPLQFFARTPQMPAGQPVEAFAAGEFRETAKLGPVHA